MTSETAIAEISHLRKRWPAEGGTAADQRKRGKPRPSRNRAPGHANSLTPGVPA
jgi:hypothetical protein